MQNLAAIFSLDLESQSRATAVLQCKFCTCSKSKFFYFSSRNVLVLVITWKYCIFTPCTPVPDSPSDFMPAFRPYPIKVNQGTKYYCADKISLIYHPHKVTKVSINNYVLLLNIYVLLIKNYNLYGQLCNDINIGSILGFNLNSLTTFGS